MNLLHSDDIEDDFFPFLRVYKDGRIERPILTARVPPGLDTTTGTRTKDVIISSYTNLSCRIFLPKMENPKKRPLLVHYHGGGFCTGTALGPITKFSLCNFAATSQAIALSVEYRLAPEYPLPIAYDDSWEALQWVATHVKGNGPEPWLNEHVDFERVYLGGESAGANIAHDVAIRASVDKLSGLRIRGLSVVHPYFGEKEPDRLYKYLCPTSSGTDNDPRLNPGVDQRLNKLVCNKVLICVAGNDALRDRGTTYYESLLKSRWRGKLDFMETEGEDHCFHLLTPNSPNTKPLIRKLAAFITDDENDL